MLLIFLTFKSLPSPFNHKCYFTISSSTQEAILKFSNSFTHFLDEKTGLWSLATCPWFCQLGGSTLNPAF